MDMAGLEEALEKLRAEPFVTSTRSMIVLSRLVEALAPRIIEDLGTATGTPPS
jgi:hypothetical protein